MKTKYILSAFLMMVTGLIHGQIIPNGMNYQGVARDRSGEVLSGKTITLQINLQSKNTIQPVVFFSEIHRVSTNNSGNFKIVIGKGSTLAGSIYEIPWSTENIWMEVRLKMDGENQFTTISNSELLAVPYAFHAGTANLISGNYSPYVSSGISSTSAYSLYATSPSTSWLVTGSVGTTPPTQYIGTSDLKDLVIKTNSVEKFKILSSGNISMTHSLTIGNDLTVGRDATVNRNIFVKNDAVIDSNITIKRNVTLNTLGGNTVNDGPFIVGNASPSVLTGTLRVDRTTNLNNGLRVNNVKPTYLSGTLRVNNPTDLFDSLTVNNQSPSVMTGTLRVDSNVLLKNRMTLTNPNFNSFSTSDGALVVYGGVGIQKNINVGGDAKVNGKTTLNGQVKITDPRPSERPDSGALVVTGGLGVGKELSVRGFVHLYDSVKTEGKTTIKNTLTVYDSANISVGSPSLHALTVTGRSELNGNVSVTDEVAINATGLGTDQTNFENYPLRVQGGAQGISIRIQGSKTHDNNFVSFWDSGSMQGRIEGFAPGQFTGTSLASRDRLALSMRIAKFSIVNVVAIAKSAAAAAALAAAFSSSTGCVGLGACVTAPIPSLMAAAGANLAAALVSLEFGAQNLADAIQALIDFDNDATTKNGITYESGAGDYAEYLLKENAAEVMFPGDIVGLKSGKITRSTEGADKVLVISVRPVVLGNMPKESDHSAYEKVAFMGQVPVKIIGKVNAGDYILPDGNNAGMGKAVSPALLKLSDVKNIVGVAWESSENANGVSTINVALGLHVNDNNRHVEELSASINTMSLKLDERNKKLEKLVAGYQQATSNPTYTTVNEVAVKNQIGKSDATPKTKFVYFEMTREQIIAGIELAEKRLKEKNKKLEDIPGFETYHTDPQFRELLIEKIQEEFKSKMEEAKAIDAASLSMQK